MSDLCSKNLSLKTKTKSYFNVIASRAGKVSKNKEVTKDDNKNFINNDNCIDDFGKSRIEKTARKYERN